MHLASKAVKPIGLSINTSIFEVLKTYIACYILFASLLLPAQNTTDSLRKVLKQKQFIDHEYIDLLNELTINLILTDPVEGISQANESLRLIETIEYPQGLFTALMHKGSALWTSGLPDQALGYYYRAKKMESVASSQTRVALNNNIAEVFKQKKLFDSALAYYNRALRISVKKGSEFDFSILEYNIGELYLIYENLDSASEYFHESYETATITGNRRGKAYALYGLGEISKIGGYPKKAVSSHLKALKLRESVGDRRGMIQSYQSLGNLYMELAVADSALWYLRKSVNEASKAKSMDLLSSSYHSLAMALEKFGELELAIRNLHLYHELQDSINQVSFINNSKQLRNVLESELVETENKLLKEEQFVQQMENRSRIIRVIFLSAILFLLALVYYQYRLRLLSRRNEERMKNRNKQLRDSAFVVSHDLREPVAQILGFIELNKSTKDVPQQETWSHMEKAAKHIDVVVRRLASQLHSQDASDKK